MIRQGNFRAEKVEYPDGIVCCIWRILDSDDESWGLCFDFAFDEIDDVFTVIEKLYLEPFILYEEEPSPDVPKRRLTEGLRYLAREVGWWLISL